MAKKVGTPKLQEDIKTDEELNIFLEKPGLLVLDIYSEWCGPCLGMITSLRKLKLDLGGDDLHFAICKADTIEVFKRFRRKSEPTWLLVTKRQAVNIMFGSNVPKLMTLITQEHRLLSQKTRHLYELDAYQPIEQERRKVKEDAENAALALEYEKKERERITYLNYVTNTIMENLDDMGVTIFGPQVNRDLIKKVIQLAEQMKIQCRDRKTIELSREDFKTIHYDCPNPISDEVLEQLEAKELFVCFWKVLGKDQEIAKLLQEFAKELQISHTQLHYENEEETEVLVPALLAPLEVKIEVELQDGEIWEDISDEKLLPKQLSGLCQNASFTSEHDELADEESAAEEEQEHEVIEELFIPGLDIDFGIGETLLVEENEVIEEVPKKNTRTKKIYIPPIWIPNNHRTHAALIYTYFRNQTQGFLPPDPEPEPPYIIMAFESYKKRDLILHAERFRDHVPMYGFFTSDEADEAKFIANSLDKYKPETSNDKIVLKVKKVTSHFMLQLATYGPSYVSPNTTVAQDEVLKFFPPTFKTAEQEAAEEENKLLKDSNDKTGKKTTKVQQKSHQAVEVPVIQSNISNTQDEFRMQVPVEAA